MAAAAVRKDLYTYRFHDKNTTGTFRQALISPYMGFIFLTFAKKRIFLNLLLVFWNSSILHNLLHFHLLKLPSASQCNLLCYS